MSRRGRRPRDASGPARRGSALRAGWEWLPRLEWTAALLLTLLVVLLHVGFLTHAGPLWRDEVNSVEFARMPTLSSIYESLRYDGFPILPSLLLRGWTAIGLGGSDLGYRLFGLVVGGGFVAALWWVCRLLGCGPPLLSLVLVGLNPWAVRAMDSVRPYGIGMLFIVLTLGLLWRALESPGWKRFLAAGAVAVLGVQCMYQDAFLLLALGLAAAVAAWRGSRLGAVAGVVLVGAAAAVSLLVYAPAISAARSWNVVVQTPSTLRQMLAVLTEAMGSASPILPWLWVGLAAVSCAAGARAFRERRASGPQGPAPSAPLYAAGVLVAAAVVFLAAIKVTRLPTQPWYYVPLAALVAPAIDAGVRATGGGAFRMGRLGLAVLIAGATVIPAWRQATERRTNVDRVASYLGREASDGDAVVVFPFYFGVSFHRYYRGAASWTTVPPIQDLRIHRYDLLKEAMTRPNAMEPVLTAMEGALRSGHRVWLVGGLPPPDMNQPAPSIPPAPHPASGWFGQPYVLTWGQQGSYFLTSHAQSIDLVPDLGEAAASPYERVSLMVASGWR